MSEWGFNDNDSNAGQGNNTEGNGPKALRDAYEKQKATIESLEQKVATFIQREEKRQMASVFDALGVPGAQDVYTGEADPEKAKAWVDSMRSVFGGAAPAAAEQPATPTLPPSMQAQYERLNQAGADAQALGNVEAAQAAINDATSVEALKAAFRNMH